MEKSILTLIAVEGGVEPSIEGQYKTYPKMLKEAKRINKLQSREDNLFYIRQTSDGKMTIHSFTNDVFDS